MSGSYKKTKVLVAGSTGFIGTNIVNNLVSTGFSVRGTIHKQQPRYKNPEVEYVQADLTLMEDCQKVVKDCEYVFMAAANTAGAAVMKSNPLSQVVPNVVMNSQMLQAAYENRVSKFVWISSSAAYPPTGDRPTTESEMFDGEPYDAYYFVGWMKRFGEITCRMYGEKVKTPMTTIVVRPTNVYGPYDDYDPASSHVTAALIRKVVERQSPIVVWGDGNDIRDIVYVDDFTEAMIRSVDKLNQYTVLNIGYGEGFTVKQILSTILKCDDYKNPKIVFDSTKPSMIPVRLVDVKAAKSLIDFEASVNMEEGLAKTIKWYRECEIK